MSDADRFKRVAPERVSQEAQRAAVRYSVSSVPGACVCVAVCVLCVCCVLCVLCVVPAYHVFVLLLLPLPQANRRRARALRCHNAEKALLAFRDKEQKAFEEKETRRVVHRSRQKLRYMKSVLYGGELPPSQVDM